MRFLPFLNTTDLIDKYHLHLDTYTWYRYRLIAPFLLSGAIHTLNIGTGGGIETLNLLRLGNIVTTIEIDEVTAQRTKMRIARNGFSENHVGHVGHILHVNLEEKFHMILMCAVLEHIKDDYSTIIRLANWLHPGGRLILSTPTASYGQLPGDKVSLEENGDHVRVGYDGLELDQMLEKAGFLVLRRIYNGNWFVRLHHRFERFLRHRPFISFLSYPLSMISRPIMPILDFLPPYHPFDQITIAVKSHIP